uniref:Tectonic-2-like n=1 Tax=Sinocyclocheilus grahami TaxID=75366 RepID=A0A672QCA9_SINGR
MLVRLSLNRSLQLCGNETSVPDCCLEPLCLQETLLVSACVDETPKASLIIQTQIYAQIVPNQPPSENKTVIPNQVFEPLGHCPCDVSPGECDIRCCCDQDCSQEVLGLFATPCLPGPFGGSFSPVPEYQCSAQSSENDPDWFPFLCVTSLSDNNPFLGLFYNGGTVSPKPSPSFQALQMTAPVPPINYRQGDPIFTKDDQYFTIPQNAGLGQCAENAPVAFLENFESQCVRRLYHALHFFSPNVCTGYQVKRPVIGGILDSDTEDIQRAQINLWQPGGDGMCSSAELRPALFGINSTSGCMIPASLLNMTQYSCRRVSSEKASFACGFRETVRGALAGLVPATLPAESSTGECSAVPTHLHIHVWSSIMGSVQGVPQTFIQAVEMRYSTASFRLVLLLSSHFPDSKHDSFSLMFERDVWMHIQTCDTLRTFSINFTEFDCDRNDVCWPELAFPLTRYYTGEPYSQALAKGLVLVFFFIAASVLGTPWRQIRQAWNSASL